jgi:hypothetical protein
MSSVCCRPGPTTLFSEGSCSQVAQVDPRRLELFPCPVRGCGRNLPSRAQLEDHVERHLSAVAVQPPTTTKGVSRKIEPSSSLAHGTTSRYQKGCRCDLCRGANRAYQRGYAQRPDVKEKQRAKANAANAELRRLAKLAKEAGLG